jgi:hypothetical protein
MLHGIFFICMACVLWWYCKRVLKDLEKKRRGEYKAAHQEGTCCNHSETDENYISELYVLGEYSEHNDMEYLH